MILAFGEFELDSELFELRRAGATIPISRRVFDTILVLLRNHHRVVTKEELNVAVWQGATVSSDAVFQAIARARMVLRDSPMRIETIRSRGYRAMVPTLRSSRCLPVGVHDNGGAPSFVSTNAPTA